MLTNKGKLKKLSLFLILSCFLLFIIYKSTYRIAGPEVEIISPLFTNTTEKIIYIEGKALNAQTLSINGYLTPQNTEGLFQKPLILSLGYNIIVVEAKDRFGKIKKLELPIYYKPN